MWTQFWCDALVQNCRWIRRKERREFNGAWLRLFETQIRVFRSRKLTMECLRWTWMAVALVLWSSTLTTAKFSPRVPHLLETGETFGLSHFLITSVTSFCILVLLLWFCTSELQSLMFYFLGKGVECLEFVMEVKTHRLILEWGEIVSFVLFLFHR